MQTYSELSVLREVRVVKRFVRRDRINTLHFAKLECPEMI